MFVWCQLRSGDIFLKLKFLTFSFFGHVIWKGNNISLIILATRTTWTNITTWRPPDPHGPPSLPGQLWPSDHPYLPDQLDHLNAEHLSGTVLERQFAKNDNLTVNLQNLKKKSFTMMISKKNCSGQQFAKILCETTICQKRLSGIVIYKVCKKKKVIRNNICKKWSIATIWNNIIRNNNLLRKTIGKIYEKYPEHQFAQKVVQDDNLQKKLSRR